MRPTTASAAIADQMAVATLCTGVRNAALIPSISATAACAATGDHRSEMAERLECLDLDACSFDRGVDHDTRIAVQG